MTLIQKIRTSFTTQLSLWVSGFVLVISVLVIILLAVFSQDAIRDESIDTTMQTLENAALRIDNTLRQTEMTARLEKQQMHVDRLRIETLIEENSYLEKIQQALPHARLYVTRRDSSRFDTYIIGSMAGYHELTYEDEDVYVFCMHAYTGCCCRGPLPSYSSCSSCFTGSLPTIYARCTAWQTLHRLLHKADWKHRLPTHTVSMRRDACRTVCH